jgi:transposase
MSMTPSSLSSGGTSLREPQPGRRGPYTKFLTVSPGDLKPAQQATLAAIERDNKPLFRAYLLKEELRSVFHEPDPDLAKLTLADWLAWASRSRLPPFVKLARTIRAHLGAIHDALDHGLSNARLEAAATKLRLLTRIAFGFHSHEPLVALAKLRLGGLCPSLPPRP